MNEVTLTLLSESLDAIQDTLEQLFDELRTDVHLEHLLVIADLKCPVCKFTNFIEGEYDSDGCLIYECTMCHSHFFYYDGQLECIDIP